MHAIYNTTLPIYVDEAYYWLWSEHLALSYFDHPPMVAWMLAFFTAWDDSVFLIRLVTVVCMSGAALFIYLLAKEVYSFQVATLSVIIFLITPAVGMGYTIVTPDSPLILFWSGALYFSYQAIFRERFSDYLLAGIFIGLGLLSKYTMVLFFGFLGLYLLIKKPRLLICFKPWLALLIAFVVASPVLIWNQAKDWISLSFQYHHGTSSEFIILWDKFFEFLGGQFLLLSPVFMVLLIMALYSNRGYFSDERRFYVAMSFLFPILFILYKALFKKMELNWGVIAYVGAVILVADFLVATQKQKLFAFGAGLSLLLIAILKFPLLFGLKDKNNPHNRMFGYEETYRHIQPLLNEGDVIMADYYTRASVFSYLHGEIAYIPTRTRMSQFDLWQQEADLSQLRGIYVSKDERLSELKTLYDRVTYLERLEIKKEGYKSRQFYIYRIE